MIMSAQSRNSLGALAAEAGGRGGENCLYSFSHDVQITHTHARTHAQTHTHARTHTHTHTRAHAHTHAHTNTHARSHIRTNTHTHARTQQARARAHTHTHTVISKKLASWGEG